jgi:hypothetical protein
MHEMPVIRASEIGQHAFCARSWWLGRVKGYASTHVEEMAGGRAAHWMHGRTVARYLRLQRLGQILLFLAALVAGIYLLMRGV